MEEPDMLNWILFYRRRVNMNMFSLWFDAKFIEVFSLNVCLELLSMYLYDYFCSLFTSSRYCFAWMTRCHIPAQNKKNRHKKRETTHHLPMVCIFILNTFTRTCLRHCSTHGSRIRTLCPIISFLFSFFLLYAFHIILSFYNY